MDELTKDYKDYLYERLQVPAEAAEYLNAALEDEDTSVFLLALRDVAESIGIGRVARASELNRENLYRILSDQGNPRLSSMLSVMQAIGVQLQVKPLIKTEGVATVSVKPSLVDTSEEDETEEPQTISCILDEEQELEYGSAHSPNGESVAA